mmetsp:Transcript_3039/g.6318  ORF Transcript_3039/g.6318 Transcript_3039/m.6318 type:complete len:205 (+) Transcript_3039:261-875(+)
MVGGRQRLVVPAGIFLNLNLFQLVQIALGGIQRKRLEIELQALHVDIIGSDCHAVALFQELSQVAGFVAIVGAEHGKGCGNVWVDISVYFFFGGRWRWIHVHSKPTKGGGRYLSAFLNVGNGKLVGRKQIIADRLGQFLGSGKGQIQIGAQNGPVLAFVSVSTSGIRPFELLNGHWGISRIGSKVAMDELRDILEGLGRLVCQG